MEGKGILEFTLPTQQKDFELASDADRLYLIIYEMDRWLRQDNDKMAKFKQKALEELWGHIKDNNAERHFE